MSEARVHSSRDFAHKASEFVAALSTPAAVSAMRSYVDALKRTGELPAYNFDQQAALDQSGYCA